MIEKLNGSAENSVYDELLNNLKPIVPVF